MIFGQTETSLFENLNFKGKDTAAWEILLMLLGAYLLGLLTYWLVHKLLHGGSDNSSTVTRSAAPAVSTSSVSRPTQVRAASVAPKKAAVPVSSKVEDLTMIEGIGPKINELLHDAGIKNFSALANATPSKIKSVLEAAGPRFRMHDPATWPKQAALAAKGDFDALEKLKDSLTAGR